MGKTTTSITLSSLEPFTGEWNFATAAHLLRRTTFGPSKADILAAVDAGMDATITALLDMTLPSPPVYFNYGDDPNAGLGETWVKAHYSNRAQQQTPRNQSLRSWIIQRLAEDRTIQEKMTFFWVNHFGVTFNGDPLARYDYNKLLRSYAVGNFRELLKAVTIHPAMLVFLNGNQNSANSPNENYGRELLELFTVGKGPQIGDGDYTNYTEEDVREISRALTGWRTRYFYPLTAGRFPEAYFQANRHDTGTKQLSYHFDGQTIENQGEGEYAAVVDLVLGQQAVARYLCQKLYRYFVYYDISDQEVAEVVEPLAQLFYDSNYDVATVLRTLLSSQHFYDQLNRGPSIKNPLEYTMSMVRPIGYGHVDASLEATYLLGLRYANFINNMGLDYFGPPSVAGWEAWYQAPVYTRSWINGSTLQARATMANRLTGNGFFIQGTRFDFDLVGWIAGLDNPTDPNALIEEITRLFLPQPLNPGQLDFLKDQLIEGLPDFEWTDEYGLYLTNPEDQMLYNSVQSKLEALFRAVFNLAEFHLS